MYHIKTEPRFIANYIRFKRHPDLIDELHDAIDELAARGTVPDGYRPHDPMYSRIREDSTTDTLTFTCQKEQLTSSCCICRIEPI